MTCFVFQVFVLRDANLKKRSLLCLEPVHLVVTGTVGSLPGTAGVLPADFCRALSQVEFVLVAGGGAGAVHPGGVCLVTVSPPVRSGHVATVVSAAPPAAPPSPSPPPTGPLVPLAGPPAPVAAQSEAVAGAGARVPGPLPATELLLRKHLVTDMPHRQLRSHRRVENLEVLNRVKLI